MSLKEREIENGNERKTQKKENRIQMEERGE